MASAPVRAAGNGPFNKGKGFRIEVFGRAVRVGRKHPCAVGADHETDNDLRGARGREFRDRAVGHAPLKLLFKQQTRRSTI